eukprot:scaffold148500_cov29-Prasinocladus_malaysianus.AAC.1
MSLVFERRIHANDGQKVTRPYMLRESSSNVSIAVFVQGASVKIGQGAVLVLDGPDISVK